MVKNSLPEIVILHAPVTMQLKTLPTAHSTFLFFPHGPVFPLGYPPSTQDPPRCTSPLFPKEQNRRAQYSKNDKKECKIYDFMNPIMSKLLVKTSIQPFYISPLSPRTKQKSSNASGIVLLVDNVKIYLLPSSYLAVPQHATPVVAPTLIEFNHANDNRPNSSLLLNSRMDKGEDIVHQTLSSLAYLYMQNKQEKEDEEIP